MQRCPRQDAPGWFIFLSHCKVHELPVNRLKALIYSQSWRHSGQYWTSKSLCNINCLPFPEVILSLNSVIYLQFPTGHLESVTNQLNLHSYRLKNDFSCQSCTPTLSAWPWHRVNWSQSCPSALQAGVTVTWVSQHRAQALTEFARPFK